MLESDRFGKTFWQYSHQINQIISVTTGAKHHAELELSRGKEGKIFDFDLLLPLSIRW